jgi:hypothetical protein
MAIRSMILVTLSMALIGCSGSKQVPMLGSISSISATLHDVPDMSLTGIPNVDVPVDQIALFSKLITPTGPCQQEIRPDLSYHVADVRVVHPDGSKTDLVVRYTGFNPAAISFDGKKYYYGGVDAAPDGAMRIVRLLREYDFDSKQKPPRQETP